MLIKFKCPSCGKAYSAPDDKAGSTGRCRKCGARLTVPLPNSNAAEANETIRPFLPLAERLGSLFVPLVAELPDELEICTEGEIAGYDTRILELAVLKGFFGAISDEPVTYVNAPQLAERHGVHVREVSSSSSVDFVNLLTLRGGGHSISGTLAGPKGAQRIVNIDDTPFDVPPVDNMVVIQNDDRPGVIGTVGTLLGNAGVNISDMDVSRVTGSDTAVMLIAPSAPVPAEVIDEEACIGCLNCVVVCPDAAIEIFEHTQMTDLLTVEGRCVGCDALSLEDGQRIRFIASVTILAAGGLGQIFAVTTNPLVTTGDGMAAAFRAGCRLMDLEFVQFHPTALYHEGSPKFLISEAVRGEGAVLRNAAGERFMPDAISALFLVAPRIGWAAPFAIEVQYPQMVDEQASLAVQPVDNPQNIKWLARAWQGADPGNNLGPAVSGFIGGDKPEPDIFGIIEKHPVAGIIIRLCGFVSG